MTDIENDLKRRLRCNDKPNCVSSVASRKFQFVEPISYAATRVAAKKALIEMIEKNPHACLIKTEDDYVHATFTTQFFQFVDDVEFIFDDSKKKIHFRSKSRVGYYDFGANKKRMLAIKKIMAQQLMT